MIRRMNPVWTDARMERVKVMRETGMTNPEIGAALHVTTDSVTALFRRIRYESAEAGVEPPSWVPSPRPGSGVPKRHSEKKDQKTEDAEPPPVILPPPPDEPVRCDDDGLFIPPIAAGTTIPMLRSEMPEHIMAPPPVFLGREITP